LVSYSLVPLRPLVILKPVLNWSVGQSSSARDCAYWNGRTMRRPGPVEYEVYLIGIDKGLCEGCGRCAHICPVDVYQLQKDPADPSRSWPSVPRPENCLNCGGCVGICPTQAITITEI
jgi:ferredoxin